MVECLSAQIKLQFPSMSVRTHVIYVMTEAQHQQHQRALLHICLQMLLNNGQKKCFSEYYDITVKWIFDLFDIKCAKFILIILLDTCLRFLS